MRCLDLTYCMPFSCESYLNKNKFIFFSGHLLVLLECIFFEFRFQHHIFWGNKSSWLSLWCKYLKCELKNVCDLIACDWLNDFFCVCSVFVSNLELIYLNFSNTLQKNEQIINLPLKDMQPKNQNFQIF